MKRLESQRTGSGSGYSSFLNTTGDVGSVPSSGYTYETGFSERPGSDSSSSSINQEKHLLKKVGNLL